jgi:hypothetical protein
MEQSSRRAWSKLQEVTEKYRGVEVEEEHLHNA